MLLLSGTCGYFISSCFKRSSQNSDFNKEHSCIFISSKWKENIENNFTCMKRIMKLNVCTLVMCNVYHMFESFSLSISYNVLYCYIIFRCRGRDKGWI